MIIIGNYANCNDKNEFLPVIESIPYELKVNITMAMADTGYLLNKNIEQFPK